MFIYTTFIQLLKVYTLVYTTFQKFGDSKFF